MRSYETKMSKACLPKQNKNNALSLQVTRAPDVNQGDLKERFKHLFCPFLTVIQGNKIVPVEGKFCGEEFQVINTAKGQDILQPLMK